MADKRDHNAKLNAAKLGAYVSDEQARQMIQTPGQSSVFIVEATHGPFVTDIDGSQVMNLLPGAVALVPKEHEDKLRKLLRAIALEQNPAETFALDGDAAAPRVDDAADDLPDPNDTTWKGDPTDPGKPPAKKTPAKKTTTKKTAAKKLAAVPDAD